MKLYCGKFTVFYITVCISSLYAQAPDTLWTKTYGGIDSDCGYSIQQTNDGNYIIVGFTESFGVGQSDVWFLRCAENGDTQWAKTYGGTDYDYGWSVQQTLDNGYIVVGWTSSFGAGGFDIYLIKTDVNGDILWTQTYGGVNDDFGNAVQVTTDSGYIIAGSSGGNVYLVKTTDMGDTIWTRTYGAGGFETAKSV